MNVALVQHAEHDVHRKQRRQNQQGFRRQRVLESSGCPLEAAVDGGGETNLQLRLLDQLCGIAQGGSGREVEGYGHCRELSLVGDCQRSAGRPEMRERRQRDLRAGRSRRGRSDLRYGGRLPTSDSLRDAWGQRTAQRLNAGLSDHVNAVQRVRRHLILGVNFEHHVILIQRLVDGRDLALTEGVVEYVVDLRGRNSEARRGIAIDDDVLLQAAYLLVAADVFEYGNPSQFSRQLGCPLV